MSRGLDDYAVGTHREKIHRPQWRYHAGLVRLQQQLHLRTVLLIGATEATDQKADAERNCGGREGALLDHIA
jgi:hypothetical protein